MPRDGRNGQVYTKIPASAFAGSVRLTGNIILAQVPEVLSDGFWEKERNVGVIVNCMRDFDQSMYPQSAAISQKFLYHFDVRSKEWRQKGYDDLFELVADCLLDGQDVLFHCQQSYHRAPICVATIMQRITGSSYKVIC